MKSKFIYMYRYRIVFFFFYIVTFFQFLTGKFICVSFRFPYPILKIFQFKSLSYVKIMNKMYIVQQIYVEVRFLVSNL